MPFTRALQGQELTLPTMSPVLLYLRMLVLLLLCIVSASELTINGPTEVQKGHSYPITWSGGNPDSVSLQSLVKYDWTDKPRLLRLSCGEDHLAMQAK